MADGSAIMIAKVNLIRYHLSVQSSNKNSIEPDMYETQSR